MTIKRYLFLLIGSIIVCTAIIQLILISVFKQHLDQEVLERSKNLSAQMVNFALEQIEVEDDEQVFIHKNSTTATNSTQDEQSSHSAKKVQVEYHYTGGNTDNENGDTFNQQKLIIKQQLHRILEKEHQQDVDVQVHTFNSDEPAQMKFVTDFKDHKVFNLKTPSATDKLINYMIYLIIISSGMALMISLWLSHHFTKPLQQLAAGFKRLKNGEFGVQLNEQGINEYRSTLNAFNQMSVQLAEFAEKEKLQQQQGHLAELGEVSRGLAHALRNPMHTIGLSVEQLNDPELPASLRSKLASKISNKIKHIDKTIKALLTLTTAEINRDQAVSLWGVLQDIVLEMKSFNNESNILLPQPEQIKPVTLYGSESEIRAILHTVIINAIEANSHQTTAHQVTAHQATAQQTTNQVDVSLTVKDAMLEIQVKDQGSGIADAVKDRLFQPHVSSKSEGAGMGLYIARRLATLYYAGGLQLNNHPDGGCIATITLNKEVNHGANAN